MPRRAADLSSATLAKYTAIWSRFQSWCEGRSRQALPATEETVTEFLQQVDNGLSTIQCAISSIAYYHAIYGHNFNTSAIEFDSVKRSAKLRESACEPSTDIDDAAFTSMLCTLPRSAQGQRDKAILCVGRFLRSLSKEVLSIKVEELSFTDDGVQLRRATDILWIPYTGGDQCPATALRAWVDDWRLKSGFVFRRLYRGDNISNGSVSISQPEIKRIIGRCARSAGIGGRITINSLVRERRTLACSDYTDDSWQYVYVYNFPSDEVLASFQGQKHFPHKVGRASGDPVDRVNAQIGTGHWQPARIVLTRISQMTSRFRDA